MAQKIAKKEEYLVKRISPDESYEDLLSFPRYLEIETVNYCNARCPMCTITDWNRNFKPMSDELFSKIADEVIRHADEVKRVTLYRDGEPLLDKKISDKIFRLKNGGIKTTSISTNVSLLTDSKAKEILQAGIDIVIMSIDSLDKDTYEGIRMGLKFEKVLENAIRFIRLRDKMRPQTSIWMRMIRQKSNYSEWPKYQRFWKERLSENDRIYYHNIFNWGGQLKGFKPVSESYEPNLPCVALWSLFVIFCNGDVPLCNADYKNNYPIGSLKTSSITDLWRSKVMEKRRMLHITGKKSSIKLCANCNVWDESPGGKKISSRYAKKAIIKS